jgi:hypothetical protein
MTSSISLKFGKFGFLFFYEKSFVYVEVKFFRSNFCQILPKKKNNIDWEDKNQPKNKASSYNINDQLQTSYSFLVCWAPISLTQFWLSICKSIKGVLGLTQSSWDKVSMFDFIPKGLLGDGWLRYDKVGGW